MDLVEFAQLLVVVSSESETLTYPPGRERTVFSRIFWLRGSKSRRILEIFSPKFLDILVEGVCAKKPGCPDENFQNVTEMGQGGDW